LGTLDEAIKEHLELKRRQGAGEDEIQQAEAEAFGPSDDDVPGASITAPAGEGDQLDKVFSGEASTGEAPPTTVIEPEPEAAAPEAPEAEAVVEEAQVEESVESPEGELEVAEVEQVEVAEVEAPPEPQAPEPPLPPSADPAVDTPPEPEAEAAPEPVDLGDGADASDLLEAERANLSGHPTENYDVDAAIAEEQELDLLSGSRLSEELDRALGEPEGLGDEPSPEPAAEVVEEAGQVEEVEPSPEPPEEPPSEEPEAASPLEETPDFLEDPDASDELWFEQGEPKDFDFGD